MKLPPQFLLSITISAVTLASRVDDGLTVPTRQGSVRGTLVTPTVRQFLGIPFARAARWELPTPPPIRPTVLDASSFGDSCVQNLSPSNVEFSRLSGVPDNDIFVPQSENCLTVNIWSPSIGRKQSTAVLVWIYGGGFDAGTSRIPTYDGTNLVRGNDDITLVSFNYRLNIFGQPHAPQLNVPGKPQNFGLKDVDAAIQWVHDNIGNFGGDPNRITIFGQSAGSATVDAYTFAHPKDTVVKGIIEQSGSVSGLVPLSPTLNTTAWNTIASAVGCGTTTNDRQLACMKAVPAQTLVNAVNSTNSAFGLVVDNVTIFSDTEARASAGNFLRVPMLTGSNAQEFDIFVVANELLATGVSVPVFTEMLSDCETLITFTCPASVAAGLRVKAGVPTFRYQYQAVFPNISPRPDLRSWHASEIGLVFGTYNLTTLPATSDEIALSKYIQSAWVSFARNPSSGLINMGWPAYNPLTSSLAQLGNFFNQSGVVFTSPALIDALCPAQATFINIAAQLSAL